MIDQKIRKEIETELAGIEKNHHLRILYACESGSRGWGFPSEDSDYDVRFIYIRPESYYLSIDKEKDTIDFPIHDDLDIGGWDIKKFLLHIRKSNPVMGEWLQSPIVYLEKENVREDLLALVREYFSPRDCMNHYLGMTKKAYSDISTSREVKIKRLFYILRPLLSALWIAQKKEVPPMEFGNLFELVTDNTVNELIMALLKKKKASNEASIITVDNTLLEYIEKHFEECLVSSKEAESKKFDSTSLNQYFMSLVKNR